MTDCHSHFLPGVDDGARTDEESLEILRFLAGAGVERVCATPHYIPHRESINDFITRRDSAWKAVSLCINEDVPPVVLGAEVRVEYGLSHSDELRRLCYDGTDRVLFELPYGGYEPWLTEEICNCCYRNEIKPTIAHLNRYPYTREQLDEILSVDDVVIQLNAEVFERPLGAGRAKKIAQTGVPVVYGFDMHRVDDIASCKRSLVRMYRFAASFPPARVESLMFEASTASGAL